MARNNSAGQVDRLKAGQDFERRVFNAVRTALEDTKLDEVLISKLRFKHSNPKLEYVNPDILVCLGDKFVLAIGAKRSFRERWKQDAFDCALWKKSYPNCKWFEVTDKENDKDSDESIQKRLERRIVLTDWDNLFSLSISNKKSVHSSYNFYRCLQMTFREAVLNTGAYYADKLEPSA